MFDQYIEASVGFIVIYSIEDKASLDDAQRIVEQIRLQKADGLKAVLVGNKIDSPRREVYAKDGYKLASQSGLKFFEASCATGENVQAAFKTLVKMLYDDDGDNNLSDGSEVHEENQTDKLSQYALMISGAIIFAALVTIFVVYREH